MFKRIKLKQQRLARFQAPSDIRIGDVIFTRIPSPLFQQVSAATGSWTNHVGIVVGYQDGQWQVAESCVPRAKVGGLAAFVARSEQGMFVVRRLPRALSAAQEEALQVAVGKRLGAWYHMGFDWSAKRQFCSKFVRQVLAEACGEAVGEVESFAQLLVRQPTAQQTFWRYWFFGRIPWQRLTVTPTSLLRCERLQTVLINGVSVN